MSAAGFEVWRDVKNMAGDVNEAMARAVLQSKVVIVLISMGYQRSDNCRREITVSQDSHGRHCFTLTSIPVCCEKEEEDLTHRR